MTITRARLARVRSLCALAVFPLLVSLTGPVAKAEDPAIVDGMPSQVNLDTSDGGWGAMAGGSSSRPYVSELSIINGDITTPVIVNGSTESGPIAPGDITAVVAPFNLCAIGQTPSPGVCYGTPNRVGITVAYSTGDQTAGYNFLDPSVSVSPVVTADTVIDMTVALNTLGKSLRWTWANGDLKYWKVSSLGAVDATVRIKFRPGPAPYVSSWPLSNGCTATPIFSCNINREDGRFLTASLVLSLDDTLDAALTGAVFATQNAIGGFLLPGGTPLAPTLDIQAASTHLRADGSPQLGTLQAFIPAAALVNLFGVLPADALSIFSTTRTGDPGTNGAPTYALWTAALQGGEGLFVTVKDITFSVPRYKVKSALQAVSTSARAGSSRTTVAAVVRGCSRKNACLATVYDLGPAGRMRTSAARTLVLRNKAFRSRKMSVAIRATRLPKGHRYVLIVRSAKTKKLLASTRGTVK